VVDGKEALRRALREAGVSVPASGAVRFHDPWGNNIEVVDYRDVQFSKTAAVLAGMGSSDLRKSERGSPLVGAS
jgi:lactoylglutathione lyase